MLQQPQLLTERTSRQKNAAVTTWVKASMNSPEVSCNTAERLTHVHAHPRSLESLESLEECVRQCLFAIPHEGDTPHTHIQRTSAAVCALRRSTA